MQLALRGRDAPEKVHRDLEHRQEGAATVLVLSRQRDETIMIGDDIELTIVDIRGDKVRIGIKAPSQVAVHRKEIYEAIRRENEQAARLAQDEMNELTSSVKPPNDPSKKLPAARLTTRKAHDRRASA